MAGRALLENLTDGEEVAMVHLAASWVIRTSSGLLVYPGRWGGRRFSPSKGCQRAIAAYGNPQMHHGQPFAAHSVPAQNYNQNSLLESPWAIMGMIGRWCLWLCGLSSVSGYHTGGQEETAMPNGDLGRLDEWCLTTPFLAVFQWVQSSPPRRPKPWLNATMTKSSTRCFASHRSQHIETEKQFDSMAERHNHDDNYGPLSEKPYFVTADDWRAFQQIPYSTNGAAGTYTYVPHFLKYVIKPERFQNSSRYLETKESVEPYPFLDAEQIPVDQCMQNQSRMSFETCGHALTGIPEAGYGAYRRPRRRRTPSPSRSHSSSSDRRMGNWLQAGWNVDRSPSCPRVSPPRELRSRSRTPVRQPTRSRAQPSQRPADPHPWNGPPAWWLEHAEEGPQHPPSPDSRGRMGSPRQSAQSTVPMWEVDERGRTILRVYWLRPGGLLINLRLTRTLPLCPADIEMMMREQFPGLVPQGRLGFTMPSGSGMQRILNPMRPIITTLIDSRSPYVVIPERGYGANTKPLDPVQQAYHSIRQHHQLALLCDAKALRTVLQANEKFVTKINSATSAGEKHDLIVSAFKRAGLAALLHAGAPRPGRKPPEDPVPGLASASVSDPQRPPDGPSAREDKGPNPNRWQRRTVSQKDGWQKVERTRAPPATELIDEWTVAIVPALKLHQAGIMLVDKNAEARAIAEQMKGTQAPSALVSKYRHDLGDWISVHRVAYHVTRTSGQNTVTVPVVGWLHQLSSSHKVGLTKAPQSFSRQSKGDTIVVKLLAGPQWTPQPIWDQLQRGRLTRLKEEATRLLQEHSPGTVPMLYDAFRLEMRGKAVTCNLRVATAALQAILAISGRSWLFVHPMGELVKEYPTVWTGLVHPETLEATFLRSRDVGGVGLTLGERHLGYRVPRAMEEAARLQLDSPLRVAWLLSGVPLAYSSGEANQILADLAVQGHVVEHTRRVGKGGQSWVVYLEHDDPVGEDVIQIQHNGREHYVTFALLKNRETAPRSTVWQRAPRKTHPRTILVPGLMLLRALSHVLSRPQVILISLNACKLWNNWFIP